MPNRVSLQDSRMSVSLSSSYYPKSSYSQVRSGPSISVKNWSIMSLDMPEVLLWFISLVLLAILSSILQSSSLFTELPLYLMTSRTGYSLVPSTKIIAVLFSSKINQRISDRNRSSVAPKKNYEDSIRYSLVFFLA